MITGPIHSPMPRMVALDIPCAMRRPMGLGTGVPLVPGRRSSSRMHRMYRRMMPGITSLSLMPRMSGMPPFG